MGKAAKAIKERILRRGRRKYGYRDGIYRTGHEKGKSLCRMDSDEGSMSCRGGGERQGTERARDKERENGRTRLARGESEDIGVVP